MSRVRPARHRDVALTVHLIARLIARWLRHSDTSGAISRAIWRAAWCPRLVVGWVHDEL